MQPTADFLGELFGPNWTAQGVSAIISSSIALVAIGISSFVAWKQGTKTRNHLDTVDRRQADRDKEFKGREHWWERFQWAMGEVASGDEDRIGVGLVVLIDLSQSDWANNSDKLLVASVMKEYLIEDSVELDEAEEVSDDEGQTKGE